MRNDINRLEPESQQTYESIRSSIVTAQHKIASAVNSSMVIAYWEIGEQIQRVRNTAPDCWNISPNGSPLNLARGSASKTYGICASFITLSQFDTHCVAN